MTDKHIVIGYDPGAAAGDTTGITTVELDAEGAARIGPLHVSPHTRAEVCAALEAPPAVVCESDRVHVETDLSVAELRALQHARATLKPRTQVARDAIAALGKIIDSRVRY